jgi:hypothetical protein
MTCNRVRKLLEEAREDDPRVSRHLESCAACRDEAEAWKAPGRLLRELGVAGPVPRLRLGLRAAVTARVGAEAITSTRAVSLRTVLAATAAVVALAVVLVSAPWSPADSPIDAIVAEGKTSADGFEVMQKGDSVEIRFASNGDRVHRIAMSTRPDFLRSKVVTVRGPSWTDPAPAPIVNGVVYYRVD